MKQVHLWIRSFWQVLVRNKDLLHGMSRQAPLTFGGIGGSITTSRRGRISDLCEAYYHESSPANIVSFSQLQEAGHKIELIIDTFVVQTFQIQSLPCHSEQFTSQAGACQASLKYVSTCSKLKNRGRLVLFSQCCSERGIQLNRL